MLVEHSIKPLLYYRPDPRKKKLFFSNTDNKDTGHLFIYDVYLYLINCNLLFNSRMPMVIQE